MRLSFAVTLLLFLSSTTTSLSIPDAKAIAIRDARNVFEILEINRRDLEKRRGGGGHSSGGGGGSSSGGSSSGGRSSGGSSSSSSSSSGGSSGSSSGSGSSSSRGGPSNSFSPSSNLGGRTRQGSGVTPAYGGGRYYGGGAAVPYTAGRKSPLGVTPFLLPLGALAIFPGLWLYGAYGYPWHTPYHYYNRTDNNSATRNESLSVMCLCQEYSVCGCDDNGNTTYVDSLLGNGSAADQNATLVRVANYNDTKTVVINGTLPNGTTASGGTDPSNADQLSGAAHVLLATYGGYWVMIALVTGIVTWL